MVDTEKNITFSTPLFQGFAVSEIAAICAAGELREIEAREILFRHGDPGDSMYVLEEGEIGLVATKWV